MLDTGLLVKIETKDLHVRSTLEQIIQSQEWLEIQRSDDSRRPDLLIFELGHAPEDEFRSLQSLMNVDGVSEVFLTSENLNHEVLLQAMRIGVKEFLSQPLDTGEVRQALERFKSRKDESRKKGLHKSGKVINVIGSKGGIGSTTIAVNLAVNLIEKKTVQSVVLMDMNMLFGEVPLFLEVAPKFNWGEVFNNASRLDASFLMNILAKHPSGVYVLSAPSAFNKNAAATLDTLERLVGLMKRMFDFVVIDVGNSLGEITLKMLEMSDQIVLVSTLSLPCLTNASKLLNSFNEWRIPPKGRVKVVLNRYLKNSDISLKDAQETINQEIFWTIPNDYRTTMSAINHGRALSNIAPRAPITKSMKELADALVGKEDYQEIRL